MLSPNARNFVRDNVGVLATATGITQEADRFSESVAVQDTSVAPTGNDDPDGGVQVTVTGCWPPSASGVVYDTVVEVPVVEIEIGDGHDTVGAAGGGGVTTTGGGVGAVGVPDLQAPTVVRSTTATMDARRFISGRTP
jgi:hypothetical protein